MRITFFTHYAELYGANLSLLNLIEGLRNFGVHAHVICPDGGDLLTVLASRAIPTARLPFEWWVSTRPTVVGAVRRLFQNVRNLGPIVEQIARWRSDLVYSNSSVIPIGAMAAARLGLPHIWHIREFGSRDYDLWPDFGMRLMRTGLRSADGTIFVSRALKRAFLGRPTQANAHVIYNGVAPEVVFDDRRRAAEAQLGRQQPFTFVLVGRFRESKGQAEAIKAFAQVADPFSDVRLLLVGGAGETGDQAYFDHCRGIVDDLGVANRVEFWGYIPDPERAFLTADVALMCSRNEAMGRVTVEAMSACRPVIGYDSGGTSELIEHGRTGFLYHGDAAILAGCMARYVEAPELACQHGEAGWHQARLRYSTEAYARQIYEVLRGVRGRKRLLARPPTQGRAAHPG